MASRSPQADGHLSYPSRQYPHPKALASESAVLIEDALARDWSRSEEDAAWAHLQRVL